VELVRLHKLQYKEVPVVAAVAVVAAVVAVAEAEHQMLRQRLRHVVELQHQLVLAHFYLNKSN
jgi:hypothetical protein